MIVILVENLISIINTMTTVIIIFNFCQQEEIVWNPRLFCQLKLIVYEFGWCLRVSFGHLIFFYFFICLSVCLFFPLVFRKIIRFIRVMKCITKHNGHSLRVSSHYFHRKLILFAVQINSRQLKSDYYLPSLLISSKSALRGGAAVMKTIHKTVAFMLILHSREFRDCTSLFILLYFQYFLHFRASICKVKM